MFTPLGAIAATIVNRLETTMTTVDIKTDRHPELSDLSREKLVDLYVVATAASVEIIGSARCACYMESRVEPAMIVRQLEFIRDAHARITAIAGHIDELIDELSGRAPPVKVDEQNGGSADKEAA